MKQFLTSLVTFMARAVVWRYRPKIIGITGSIGKTSAKEAIAIVLGSKFSVRQSVKSYNNELGLPLAILGRESPGRSVFGWISLAFFWLGLIIWRSSGFPEFLILEMGADRPGDISHLLSIAPCDIGVLTAIAPTHLEKFLTIAGVAKEKRKIIQHLKPGGVAILNADDDLVDATGVPQGSLEYRYGLAETASVRASDVHYHFGVIPEEGIGTTFKLHYQGNVVPVHVPDVVGLPAASAALAAASVGLASRMNLVQISQALMHLKPPPGRLHLLKGIKDTMLIDDTYNSSPRAVVAALDLLARIPVRPPSRRIAVLGDMRELGSETEAAHAEMGAAVASYHVDILVTVGESARTIARSARQSGMDPDHIYSFSFAEEAGEFLRERMQRGDAVLLKGSQNFIRLERTVKMVMAEPERANDLLVRQGPEWTTEK